MKKVLIGAIAGAAISLVIYKLAKDGKFDNLCDDVEDFAGKTKDKAEYYANRTSRKAKVAKRNLSRKVDDLKETIQEKLHNDKLAEAK
ncbi:MAG: YtxH domain-containing protein [Dysgonomonas sp.]